MSVHMSTTLQHQNDIQDQAEYLRRFWTSNFASGIENARIAAGRSIDEAARLAGMELSEWLAMEAVPRHRSN